MSIKIVLADDHQMFREGIKGLLEKEHGFTVVGEAHHGHDCIRLVGQLNPDIVLMDIYMPHLNGIEATKQIRAKTRKCKVIGLSSSNDKLTISRMLGRLGH